MSTLKPPRAVQDSALLDTTQLDMTTRETGSTDRLQATYSAYSFVPVLNLSPPSAVGRVVARSIPLFCRADWSFSSAVAIDCVGDALLLLQAGTSRAFSSTIMMLTSTLES